jgi:hypothetical protein
LRRKSRKNYYGKEKESSKEEESCKEAPLNLSGHPLERKNTDSSVFFLSKIRSLWYSIASHDIA